MTNLIFKFLRFFIFGRFDSFLKNQNGVIHIGANTGQEISHYKNLGVVKICWIEADPNIYKTLIQNIKGDKNQKAYNYLVTKKNNKKYNFNISNNEGNSSSIFLFKEHKQIYPDVKYNKKIILIGKNLKYIIRKEKINLKNFSALVLDVQGAELEILQGAKDILYKFKYIKLETAEFMLYSGGANYYQIQKYLSKLSFYEKKKIVIAKNRMGKKAFDVLYYNKKFAV
jgi:FkbM family methyltransferase